MLKIVDGFPAYRISSSGKIETSWQYGPFYGGMKVKKKWKPLPTRPNAKGYISLNLREFGGKGRRVYLHRLVAETFISPKPFKKACIRHLDGKTKNNHYKNLAWGTYLDNENDKIRHGTHKDRISNAKLTKQSRAFAFRLSKSGIKAKAISVLIGVSRPTISRLLSGATWKN